MYRYSSGMHHIGPETAERLKRTRFKLFVLVHCWLALAYVCRLKHTYLPPRISRFVAQMLFKAEVAVNILIGIVTPDRDRSAKDYYFLDAANAFRNGMWAVDCVEAKAMALREIIERLYAIRRAIKRIKQRSARPVVSRGRNKNKAAICAEIVSGEHNHILARFVPAMQLPVPP